MIPLILTVPPNRLNEVRNLKVTVAHMAYRIGKGPHLFRSEGMPPPRGGLMVIDSRNFDGWGGPSIFCQEVFRECRNRGFRGVICDFEQTRIPLLEKIVQELGQRLSGSDLTLYVSEDYAAASPHAKIMISSAISGGSLEARLETAISSFGRERIVLALESVAVDFFLPSNNKNGTPLSDEQLSDLRSRLSPSIFFSKELCARYFTYMSRDSGAHFVLFDDGETIVQKLKLAERMQLPAAIAAWPELCQWRNQLNLRNDTSHRP